MKGNADGSTTAGARPPPIIICIICIIAIIGLAPWAAGIPGIAAGIPGMGMPGIIPGIATGIAGLGAIKIALFGSWAARYRGEPGPPPNDLDVLLVGEIDRENAYEAARRAESRLGFPVNPTLFSVDRWDNGDDPLTRTIKSSALVDILTSDVEPAR